MVAGPIHTGSVGFSGPINEAGEANRFAVPLVRFKVADGASWLVTAVTTSALTVSIAAGTAECCGVYDITTAAQQLTVTANTGATARLDAIVARWTWGSGGVAGNVVFDVLTGTSATVPPTPVWNPGIKYEALLAVVTVPASTTGALAPANISDIRPYGGAAGPLTIKQANFYTYVDVPVGGELQISPIGNGVRYVRKDDGTWFALQRPVFLVPGLDPAVPIISVAAEVDMATNANGDAMWALPAGTGITIIDNVSITDSTPNTSGLGLIAFRWTKGASNTSVTARVYGLNGPLLNLVGPRASIIAYGH